MCNVNRYLQLKWPIMYCNQIMLICIAKQQLSLQGIRLTPTTPPSLSSPPKWGLCAHCTQSNNSPHFGYTGLQALNHGYLSPLPHPKFPTATHSLARRPFLPPLMTADGLGPTSPSAVSLGCASTSAARPRARGSGSALPHHAGVDPVAGSLSLPPWDPDPAAKGEVEVVTPPRVSPGAATTALL
jgi:hypothetical protein